MPIPLGILAAAGFRPTAGGSYELIETITVGSTSVSSVTFNNLNTYASTYQHLQIRYATLNSTAYWYAVRINGDTTSANYRSHRLVGNGSHVSSATSTGEPEGATILGLYGSSTVPGSGVIDFLDPYETNKNKTFRALSGFTAGNVVALTSGLYMSTNAISSITLHTQGYNALQGSRFSIYGLKAS